jgi:hypothetical protein
MPRTSSQVLQAEAQIMLRASLPLPSSDSVRFFAESRSSSSQRAGYHTLISLPYLSSSHTQGLFDFVLYKWFDRLVHCSKIGSEGYSWFCAHEQISQVGRFVQGYTSPVPPDLI